jgi:hypothetical protein
MAKRTSATYRTPGNPVGNSEHQDLGLALANISLRC